MKISRVRKIEDELAKRMIANGGRWCEITIKDTGEVYQIIRQGYGSMEYPERDPADIVDADGNTVFKGKRLEDVAEWIALKY